jgi:hypothetical protein
MVATASTLNTGTIFQFSNFMTSSSAGIFAGANQIETHWSSAGQCSKVNSEVKKGEDASR